MRPIDADALMKVIREHDYPLRSHFNSTDNGMFTIGVQQAVDDAPTISAAPVVRGEWILIGRGRITKSRDLKCSVCGNYFRVYDDVTLNAGRGDANFCPNCGAKMDKEAQCNDE